MTDTSLDHRTLEWAVEIIGMCEPIRCVQGGMWFGRNHNMADATFVDYGAADAFAVAAKALPALVKALTDILAANKDFRDGMPQSWDGDPLQDACDAAHSLIPSAHRAPTAFSPAGSTPAQRLPE